LAENKFNKLGPFKPCEFLKTHDEITLCNTFMEDFKLVPNPCDCKNWDLAHILPQLSHGNILDMGCQGSLVLANALCVGMIGEKWGIDLAELPPLEGANIVKGDITRTDLPSDHFDYITCLSVIEHGVNAKAFVDETYRLLKPEGTLWVTFDYWPQKIEHDIRLFDLPWTIYCQEDVVRFLDIARQAGLEPAAEIDWTIDEGVICPGYHSPGPFSYTFGVLQMRKLKNHPSVKNRFSQPNVTNDVLIINSTEKSCGVYQFGQNTFDVLSAGQKKYRFHLAECGRADDVLAAAETYNPCAALFNFAASTLQFVDRELLNLLGIRSIGIYHEITQEIARVPWPPVPFDFWIHSDPSVDWQSPFFHGVGRNLFQYENQFKMPAIPTIGSFGFGFKDKGFAKVAEMVEKQFDEAVLRLHIPFARFGDADGTHARARVEQVRDIITKPGIRLEFTHHLMSTPELLDFLAQNSINVFLYDEMRFRGISSVIDYALSVDRPIAISKSYMFRHLWGATPSIVAEDSSLPQIIASGIGPLRAFKAAWTREKLVGQYETAIDRAIALSRSAKVRT
jgi:hypothetical protein